MRVDIGGGVRLYVDVEGLGLVPDGATMKERPTLLYIHGGPGADHTVFKTEGGNALSDIAQLVYYDQRGGGRSDWRTEDEWTMDTWADDVVRLCDVLGIEKPIVLGASFGGFVAQHYIARHPEHPAKVILAGTGPRFDLDAIERAFIRFGGEAAGPIARKFFAGDLSVFADFISTCMPLYSTEPLDPNLMTRGVMNFEMTPSFFRGPAHTIDLRPGLANAQCPVLVLSGELDPVMPVELNREIVSSLPDGLGRFELFPGISHMQVGNGDDCERVIREFILAP